MTEKEGGIWRKSMAASKQPTKHSRKLGAILVVGLFSIAILVGAIFASLGYFNPQNSASSIDQLSANEEKGLDFIQKVLSLDTSKYNVSIKTLAAPAPSFATIQQLELAPTLVDYDLNSSLYSIKITCTFTKGVLTMCNMDVRNDTLSSLRQYRNLTEIVKDFLGNYQAFSGQDCTTMIETLANVNPKNNQDSTLSGSLKLTTTHKDLSDTAFGDTYQFSWVYTYNNCDYPALIVSYRDGVFSAFKDERAIYSLGDTTVNISKEQAIAIAMEAIKNYSYRMSNDWVVTGFNVTENKITANLLSTVKDGSVLYPYWSVTLPLNGTWPGSVTELLVGIWADTGEIYFVHYQAYAQLYPEWALT